MRPGPIWVVGPPRSGTTWVGEILCSAVPGLELIEEPDNEKRSGLARCLKAHLPRFPHLRPGEADSRYALLWRCAFFGRFAPLLTHRSLWRVLFLPAGTPESFVSRKERSVQAGAARARGPLCTVIERMARAPSPEGTGRLRLVKSVHSVLAAEWVAKVSGESRVVVVLRSPYAVVASLRRMRMPDRVREGCFAPRVQDAAFGRRIPVSEEPNPELTRMTVQLAAMVRLLEDAASRNPDWIVVRHENLCVDPPAAFAGLCERLGLEAGRRLGAEIDRRNRPGEGYAAVRVAGAEIGKWRKDLSPADAERITEILSELGLEHWREPL